MQKKYGGSTRHYRISALTNISKEWLDFKIDKFRLYDYFLIIVSSGYSGVKNACLWMKTILFQGQKDLEKRLRNMKIAF